MTRDSRHQYQDDTDGELANKHFKASIIKIPQQAGDHKYSETHRKTESCGREIEDIKKNQMERLELKNTIS